MDRQELEQLWGEVLRSPGSDSRRFDELAAAVTDVYASGDPRRQRLAVVRQRGSRE